MSKTIKKYIAIITLAGILLTPACSHKDNNNNTDTSGEDITATASPSGEPSGEAGGNTTPGSITTDGTGQPQKPPETGEAIKVITNDQELEEYFNSISDEELEELFKIIEGIDISSDINPDADPGFDEVIIP